MKILNLIQCANLGGTEKSSLRLMCGLKDCGHSIRLLSLNPIGHLGPLLETAGIAHEGLPYLGKAGWRSRGLLKAKLAEIEADAMIMTGHNLLASLALGDFCKGRRILALHFHHYGVKPKWQWKLIYAVARTRFNALTFPCQYVRNEAETIFPAIKALTHTIRNPLDMPALPTPQEQASNRRALRLPLDRPVIGNAGGLIPRKRFDVFLEVAAKIIKQGQDATFVIAGDGPERSRLEALAQKLGIARNVCWLGWQEDLAAFYKSLDLLLFNSDWDAFPTTPQEAMSYAVPVVCSVANGGLAEIITSDEVGFLRPSHDISQLAELALRLLRQRSEAETIGRAGRTRVESVTRAEPIVRWHERVLLGAREGEAAAVGGRA